LKLGELYISRSLIFGVSSWVALTALEIYTPCVRVNVSSSSLKKMGKQRFKTIKLFLKLILLFQIYSHNKFEAEPKVLFLKVVMGVMKQQA